jgi:hypothetical protein
MKHSVKGFSGRASATQWLKWFVRSTVKEGAIRALCMMKSLHLHSTPSVAVYYRLDDVNQDLLNPQ